MAKPIAPAEVLPGTPRANAAEGSLADPGSDERASLAPDMASPERLQVPASLAELDCIRGRAIFLGERIDVRQLAPQDRLGVHPLAMPVGAAGVAVLFRYGVVVLFHTTTDEELHFLREIAPRVAGANAVPEMERVTIQRRSSGDENIDGDTIFVREITIERLQLVACVLSRSVVLAEYEARVADNINSVEPFAVELQTKGRGGRQMKKLLQQIGNVLLTEHKMVARVEVGEKPELLWDRPELEPLYLRLEDEFEISERSAALERKLALASRTVVTVLELLENRRTLRVEWYIVILIVLEIGLTIYELFLRHP